MAASIHGGDVAVTGEGVERDDSPLVVVRLVNGPEVFEGDRGASKPDAKLHNQARQWHDLPVHLIEEEELGERPAAHVHREIDE